MVKSQNVGVCRPIDAKGSARRPGGAGHQALGITPAARKPPPLTSVGLPATGMNPDKRTPAPSPRAQTIEEAETTLPGRAGPTAGDRSTAGRVVTGLPAGVVPEAATLNTVAWTVEGIPCNGLFRSPDGKVSVRGLYSGRRWGPGSAPSAGSCSAGSAVNHSDQGSEGALGLVSGRATAAAGCQMRIGCNAARPLVRTMGASTSSAPMGRLGTVW